MNFDFKGKVCVITGGGSGIGKELAIKYAELGAEVVILGRKMQTLQNVANLITSKGGSVLAIEGDVSVQSQVDHAMKIIETSYGRIDILANCAGISQSKLMLDVDENDWDHIMNVNLKSVYMMSRKAAQNMIDYNVKNGKIITISSISSKIGEVGNGVYSVSKAAVNSLIQVLAQEWGKYGISVTAVSPGYVNTELLQEAITKRAPLENMTKSEYENHLLSSVPLGRMVEPGEVADFMIYLSSDHADYFSGVSLTMAGGKMLI